MKIPAALRPAVAQAGARALDLLASLRPGQELAARVLAPLGRGQVRLLLGSTELVAATPLRLAAGDRLRLVVEKGLPQPVLRLLTEPPPGQPLKELARQALVRQQPPGELAGQARSLAPQAQAAPSPLARQAVEALARPALSMERLDAPALRRTLAESGLFLEARLARGLPPLPSDRKLALLRLLRDLAPRPTGPATSPETSAAARRPSGEGLFERLLQLVEAGVSRIQHHQAASLAGDDPARSVWRIDLPLQQGERRDELQLRIRREAPADADAEAGWEAEVHFDFEETGPVNARIGFRQGQVSCSFRAERADTVQRFAAALPMLERRLEAAGLSVASLGCSQGASPPPDAELPRGLLDEQA
ncbi:MAG TPA: flagellar hook-length control protein FliK [Gammaproteobacteria bacterium]|nr:flagellar hook-length control protein FliK [Gammaproteobacteria bacterium]